MLWWSSRGYPTWKDSPAFGGHYGLPRPSHRGTLRPPPPKPASQTFTTWGYSACKNSPTFGGPYGLPRPSHQETLRAPPTYPQASHPSSDGIPLALRGNSYGKNSPHGSLRLLLSRRRRHRKFPRRRHLRRAAGIIIPVSGAGGRFRHRRPVAGAGGRAGCSSPLPAPHPSGWPSAVPHGLGLRPVPRTPMGRARALAARLVEGPGGLR